MPSHQNYSETTMAPTEVPIRKPYLECGCKSCKDIVLYTPESIARMEKWVMNDMDFDPTIDIPEAHAIMLDHLKRNGLMDI